MSNSTPINLAVYGIGHVPSFKNSKLLTRGRLITDPKKQEWMEWCIQSFVSQLRSALQTRGIATTTGPIPLSKIASLLPLDDSRKWIPEHSVSTRLVSKGSEGAELVIENHEGDH